MKIIIIIAGIVPLLILKTMAQIPCNLPSTPTASVLLYNLNQRPVLATRPSFYIEGCNVTDTIKEKLAFRIRNWQWSKEEIDSYLKNKIASYKDFYAIDERAKSASQGNDSLYNFSKDSLTQQINSDMLKSMNKDHLFVIEPNLILSASWLNMREMIPFLRDTALKDGEHYAKWSLEIALARMGDKKLIQKFIAEDEKIIPAAIKTDLNKAFFESFKKMTFLGTQESIFQLHKWIDTSLVTITDSQGSLGRLSGEYLLSIKRAILNKDFQQLVRQVNIDELSNANDLIAAKKWLIKNKGRYEINRQFCPY